MSTTKFDLGVLVITPNARDTLPLEDVQSGINKHAIGVWGDLCDEDRLANDHALKNGGRLFSAYFDRNEIKFWIITEADRSVTTVLLPEDY